MSWAIKRIQDDEEVARNEFWVDLSACDSFVLQKKMSMVSGGSDRNQGSDDELSFRIKVSAMLSKEDKEVLNPPRRVKAVELKKERKQDSIFARLTKKISSSPQQQVNSSPRLLRSETTAFSQKDTKRPASSLSEGSFASKPLTRSKSAGLRDQILSSNLRTPRQKLPQTFLIASGKNEEDILPYWMHVVFVATQPSSLNPMSQIIHLSKSSTQQPPKTEGTCAKPKQMNFTLKDHMVESRSSQPWNCLKPEESQPSPRRTNGEGEILAACHARILRESDGVLFSGILLVTSSQLDLLVQKEWKDKKLFDSKGYKEMNDESSSEEDLTSTPPSRKAVNPKDDPLRLLKQIKPEIDKLKNKTGQQSSRMSIPFTSVLAMWRSKSVSDKGYRSRPLQVQTMTSQYSIIMTDLGPESRRSILYLIDQIWRWVISLTFQRIKDTCNSNLGDSTPSRSPILSTDSRSTHPFYNIPVEHTECVLETECFLWLNFLHVPGVLYVTQDVLVFQSSHGSPDEPSGSSSTSQPSFSTSPSPDMVVFSIQLPTITEIEERERSLVTSPSHSQFRIFSISTLSRKKSVVLSVNRSRDDVIPLLLQLWAAAVRSPHFFAQNSVTMTPPSLVSNEKSQLESSKWFDDGPTKVDDKWTQLFDSKGSLDLDFWREPFVLNLICNGIPNSLRANVWQITSGSFFLRSRSISNAQRRCLMSSIPSCVSREDLSTDQEEEVLITYEDYLNRIRESKKKFLFMEEIERDLHRSLPEHPLFHTIDGTCSLRRILFAYGARNPEIGYCQSMNIIGALLLCWMDEAMAFWTLTVVVERILVDYYCPSMRGICIDQMVLQSLVSTHLPEVERQLQELEICLSVVSMKWFMCLFIQCLPWQACLHVLDSFFAVGVLALFRTALGLLDYFQDQLLRFEDPADVLLLLRKCEDVDPVRFFKSVSRFEDSVTADDIEVLRDFHRPQFDETLASQASSSLGQFEEMSVDEENQLLLNIGLSEGRAEARKGNTGNWNGNLSTISVPSLEVSPNLTFTNSSPRLSESDSDVSRLVPQLNFTTLPPSPRDGKGEIATPIGIVSYHTPRMRELSERGRVRSVSTDRGTGGPEKRSKQLVELAGHFRNGRVKAGEERAKRNGRHSMYSTLPNSVPPSSQLSTPRDKLQRIRAMSKAE